MPSPTPLTAVAQVGSGRGRTRGYCGPDASGQHRGAVRAGHGQLEAHARVDVVGGGERQARRAARRHVDELHRVLAAACRSSSARSRRSSRRPRNGRGCRVRGVRHHDARPRPGDRVVGEADGRRHGRAVESLGRDELRRGRSHGVVEVPQVLHVGAVDARLEEVLALAQQRVALRDTVGAVGRRRGLRLRRRRGARRRRGGRWGRCRRRSR